MSNTGAALVRLGEGDRRRAIGALLLHSFAAVLGALVASFPAQAQVEQYIEPPERKYLYQEDAKKKENEQRKRAEAKQKRDAAKQKLQAGANVPLDINATSIDYDNTGNVIEAQGDVIVTYGSTVAEARRGQVNVTTNEAKLEGDVRISDVTSNISADSAFLDMDDGSAELKDADIFFAEGDYQLFARDADRAPGDVYTLEDTVLSTCHCPEGDDCLPWSLRAKDAEITREGYGYAWNTSFAVFDVPVFYFPFLMFPAKNERQSGLLFPTIGSGRQSGLTFELPFFWAIDESTDSTITAVYESEIRSGADIEFRKLFSRRHSLEAGFVYLNESQRNGDLLGTNVENLDDPTFDENRIAGYVDHSWSGSLAGQPLQFLLDGNYVSDDLFLREYEKSEIDDFNTRFVTSTAVLRTPIGTTYGLDLRGEYNQAIVDDDDFVFQRLPEVALYGIDSFRPFGENPLGLKVSANTNLTSVHFTRRKSFEGVRSELNEQFKMPFYFGNYFDGQVNAGVRGTLYNVTQQDVVARNDVDEFPDGEVVGDVEVDDDLEATMFDSTSNRVVPNFGGTLNTVLERVFTVPDDSSLKRIAELGTIGRREKLVRLKHTLEPGLKYRYVPYVSQEENPQFDSQDRLAERNVVTYELVQRLYGRYEPRDPYVYGIEEATPELTDLGTLRSTTPLDQDLSFGFEPENAALEYQRLRQGSVREMANFELSQSFDVNEERKDLLEDEDAFSDVSARLALLPNE
ncbi:MAG: LPS-assembly protein LptD [Bdellovibrionales bacterium]|nr:LPS-assembly protein LptD [Bdellovibrionales bacterium]